MIKKREKEIVLFIVIILLVIGSALLWNIIFNKNTEPENNNKPKTNEVEKKQEKDVPVDVKKEIPQKAEKESNEQQNTKEVPKTENDQNSVESKAKTVDVASIDLNGEQQIYMAKGEKYIDPGAKAIDSKGNDISNQIKIDNSVDTSKVGEYTVVYSIGNYIVIRTVVVK